MPRRKQPRRMTVQDIRTILRLTHEQGLSVREVALRLKLSKTTVATYLHRAREAGLDCWPLPSGRDDDATLKRKGVTLVLLWEEYRAAHPDGYGPEFIAEAVRGWINAVGAKTAYIEPGSPWENGYCESFMYRRPRGRKCFDRDLHRRVRSCIRPVCAAPT